MPTTRTRGYTTLACLILVHAVASIFGQDSSMTCNAVSCEKLSHMECRKKCQFMNILGYENVQNYSHEGYNKSRGPVTRALNQLNLIPRLFLNDVL